MVRNSFNSEVESFGKPVQSVAVADMRPESREQLTESILETARALKKEEPLTVVIQTMKEEKAKELVRYCAILVENQESFLQQRHPIARKTDLQLEWVSGSRIFGILAASTRSEYITRIQLFSMKWR